MPDRVKRRHYESPRRRRQAEETRMVILGAAGVLFRESGYGGASMAAIAAKAEVAVETIYRVFGTKAALFTAVVEAAVAGGATRAATPVEARPAIRAIIEERDPERQIALYAATQPGIHRRSGPLLRALFAAASSDPDLAKLSGAIEADRLAGQARFTGMLAERGALRAGVDAEQARDVIWTLCSLAIYDLLVGSRGWSEDRYRTWLTEALVHELLPRPVGSSPASDRLP
jgi:AcrR family transcriptional regulator